MARAAQAQSDAFSSSLGAGRSIAGLPVVLYLRASLDKTGEFSSVETQERDGRRSVAASGATPLDIYRDNNISASDPRRRRPGFSQMLEDIETGRIGPALIVCFDIARLYRNDEEKRRLEGLFDKGTHVLGIWDGVDTRDPLAGRIVWDILGRININKKAEIGRYLRSYEAKQRERGIPHFGVRPFGYEFAGSRIGKGGGTHPTHLKLAGYGELAQPEIDELIVSRQLIGEPAHLRWAIDTALRGTSLNKIRQAWNDPDNPHHCLTTRSNRWGGLAVRTVLTAARNAGRTEDCHYLPYKPSSWQPTLFRDDEWEAEHGFPRIPAVMTIEELLLLRHWLQLRGQGIRNTDATSYLLSGLLICKGCGRPLYAGTGNIKGRNFRYFDCRRGEPERCPKEAPANYVRMELIDEVLSAATVAAISSGAVDQLLHRAATERKLGPLMSQIRDDEMYLQQFRSDAIEARIPLAKINDLLSTVTARLDRNRSQLEYELRANLPSADIPDNLTRRIEQHWATRDMAWRREMISLVWSRIEIRPGLSLRGVRDRSRRLAAVADRLTLIARESL